MNERDQRLADSREDERIRYYTNKRTHVAFEAEIRSNERQLMMDRGRTDDRRDIREQTDDTGFAPGGFI